jgi:hypothetical protein
MGFQKIDMKSRFEKIDFYLRRKLGAVSLKSYSDTGIQKNLDFGCGFGFLNPKSKLNQKIQKTKKPHPKPNHKIKKTKNQIQNQ